MAVDYSVAGEYADHVHALAVIESGESLDLFGDGGQAFGILQQHPSYFIQFYRETGPFAAETDDTWWTAQIKAAARFLNTWEPEFGMDGAIMAYNLGVEAYKQGKRNEAYLSRWSDAYQKIRSAA
jgi:hypothetical protein